MLYENEAANNGTESVEGYVMIICADRVRCNFHYPTELQHRRSTCNQETRRLDVQFVDE